MAAQLVFFRRRTTVPLEQLMAGAPREAMTIQGYWCGTNRQFVPVPDSEIAGRHRGVVEEFEILAGDRTVARVGWMPWADGHVLVFVGAGPPPPEVAHAYLGGGEKLFPGSQADQHRWLSRVRPGPPDSFVQTSLGLFARTNGRFSARSIRISPSAPSGNS